jgi:hypothetical protein
MEYDGKCPHGCPICTPEKYPQTDNREEAAVMFDLEISAYASYVAFLEVVDERGDATDERLALDCIDDIVSAGFSDSQGMRMVHTVMDVTRLWELDSDARKELEITKQWLEDNRGG